MSYDLPAESVAHGRINLAYGGDDITTALSAILAKSSFPYRDLNLARSQDWIMMDKLKIKICTLEEVGDDGEAGRWC